MHDFCNRLAHIVINLVQYKLQVCHTCVFVCNASSFFHHFQNFCY